MKKNLASLAFVGCAAVLFSCNDGTDTTTSTTDSSSTTTVATDAGMDTSSMSTNNTSTVSSTPLEATDAAFVLKAASGGMMEVESGRIAQEKGMSQRVKDFGAMLVRDHTAANTELEALATSKGMMIPKDSLMAKHKPHLDEMSKMSGAAFDKHFISMMMNDHKKDIAEFEKKSGDAKDADLKAFATKTLPVLKMHRDTVTALSKMK